MALALNVVAFQIGWFACVLGGANSLPWLGTLLAAGVVVVHLARVPRPAAEAGLIGLAGVLGGAWDSLLVAIGLVSYPSGTLIAGTAPHWMVALWLIFATTLNVSLRWLRGRGWVAAALGAIGGPLAYYAGYKLGAVSFIDTGAAMIVLAGGWALLMPLLVAISVRFDGVSAMPSQRGYARA